ncbi:MAG: TetR/AcrR family transcriptional regulator [Dehalococcoides mccartyi]|uniref:TetR/AcrR family transcriptional regulator n=1 Tax=Dehalococcoides mccartyi TaxID=61435 RepID=UPI001A079B8D|nr:TetR/AcrR family transcriptional regulator [Dehalococcoides mccartyi]MBF4481883.1 TetR/AcrR family transcriptional regulator [Dehalococcoides mccartyi]MBJ7531239.1 TetR/AcrR family transcriptional regulator [Dehalococcoides mccartyi]
MPETAKPETRKIQAEKRRQEILDAALKVFAEQGYQGATISQISEAAGTSLGLLYHYFSNKEALMEAVIAEHSFLPLLKNIIAKQGKQSIESVLSQLCLQFYRLLESKKELVAIFLREGTSNPAVSQVWFSMIRQGVTSLISLLDQGVKQGVLKEHRLDVTARTLMSAVVMLYLTREAYGEGFTSPEDFIPQMIASQLSGIKSPQKE